MAPGHLEIEVRGKKYEVRRTRCREAIIFGGISYFLHLTFYFFFLIS